jgi:hypothetical protein
MVFSLSLLVCANSEGAEDVGRAVLGSSMSSIANTEARNVIEGLQGIEESLWYGLCHDRASLGGCLAGRGVECFESAVICEESRI